MKTHEKSTQTKDSSFFKLASKTLVSISANPRLQLERSLYKIKKHSLDVEDLIIDRLASRHTSYIRGVIKNKVLRKPYKLQHCFKLSKSQTNFGLQVNLQALRFLHVLPHGKSFFEKFEFELLSVHQDYNSFLTVFHKYKHSPNRTLLQGLSVFLLFLAKFFKSKYVTTTAEFLLYFVYTLYQDHGIESQVSQFLTDMIRNPRELAEPVEKKFSELFGSCDELFTIPSELVEMFLEYLASNDILPVYRDIQSMHF